MAGMPNSLPNRSHHRTMADNAPGSAPIRNAGHSGRTGRTDDRDDVIAAPPTPSRRLRRRTGRHGRTTRIVVLSLLAVLIIGAGAPTALAYRSAAAIRGHLSDALKALQSVSASYFETSPTDLRYTANLVTDEVAAAQRELASPVWSVLERMPGAGEDVATVRAVVDTLSDITATTIPELQQAANILFDADLSPDGSALDVTPVSQAAVHLDKAAKLLDAQTAAIDALPDARLGQLRVAVQEGREDLDKLNETVTTFTGVVDMIPSFLGGSGARDYVIIAQTNAENRSSGGMIGSAGSAHAENGTLSVGEFHPDADFHGSAAGEIRDGESEILPGLGFGYNINNVTSSPDFPQVARMVREFWRQQSFGGESDGVIALDPVALQSMIAVTGPVTLSNGQTLDGDNTAEYLLNTVYKDVDHEDQDRYFSETAREAVSHMFSAMDLSKLASLVQTLTELAGQRHFLFWSFHDEDTAALRAAGLTGEVGTDPAKPVTGMYLNQMEASKLDWYIDRRTIVRGTGTNDDGSATYHVTVTVTNRLTADENATLPSYINEQSPDGSWVSRVLILTPAGGSVDHVVASDGTGFATSAAFGGTHTALVTVPVDSSMTIEWDVTTAAGADPLLFDQTPTCDTDPNVEYWY